MTDLIISKKYTLWGSNPRPFACKANVITTTLSVLDISSLNQYKVKYTSVWKIINTIR